MKRLPNFPVKLFVRALDYSRWPDGSLRWTPFKREAKHRDHNFEIAMRRAMRLGKREFDKQRQIALQ